MAGLLPEAEPLFPEDAITDRPERFFAAEIVRETAFHHLREEIPYAVAVAIEHWIEEEGRLVIEARIIVEEESQKRIVVGRGGAMIKAIGTEARRRIQEFLGRRLHLGLTVIVRKSWRDDAALLERLIEAP
jgi:GTP-binding protein Era